MSHIKPELHDPRFAEGAPGTCHAPATVLNARTYEKMGYQGLSNIVNNILQGTAKTVFRRKH